MIIILQQSDVRKKLSGWDIKHDMYQNLKHRASLVLVQTSEDSFDCVKNRLSLDENLSLEELNTKIKEIYGRTETDTTS